MSGMVLEFTRLGGPAPPRVRKPYANGFCGQHSRWMPNWCERFRSGVVFIGRPLDAARTASDLSLLAGGGVSWHTDRGGTVISTIHTGGIQNEGCSGGVHRRGIRCALNHGPGPGSGVSRDSGSVGAVCPGARGGESREGGGRGVFRKLRTPNGLPPVGKRRCRDSQSVGGIFRGGGGGHFRRRCVRCRESATPGHLWPCQPDIRRWNDRPGPADTGRRRRSGDRYLTRRRNAGWIWQAWELSGRTPPTPDSAKC